MGHQDADWVATFTVMAVILGAGFCAGGRPEKAQDQRTVQPPIEAGSILRSIQPISKVRLQLPAEAARLGVLGPVLLEVRVDEQGSVSVVKVVRVHPLLNELAATAVRQWKYQPVDFRGQTVPTVLTVAVPFQEEPDGE